MNTNGNAAYDFDRFAAKEARQPEKPQAKIVKIPQKNTSSRPKITMKHIVRGIAAAAVCFVMMGSLILSQLQLNELNTSLQKVNKQLSNAKSEYVQLQMAAEARASLETVEEYAANVLGMQKLSSDQIEYVRLNEGDRIEVSEQSSETSVWQKISDWFAGIFS